VSERDIAALERRRAARAAKLDAVGVFDAETNATRAFATYRVELARRARDVKRRGRFRRATRATISPARDGAIASDGGGGVDDNAEVTVEERLARALSSDAAAGRTAMDENDDAGGGDGDGDGDDDDAAAAAAAAAAEREATRILALNAPSEVVAARRERNIAAVADAVERYRSRRPPPPPSSAAAASSSAAAAAAVSDADDDSARAPRDDAESDSLLAPEPSSSSTARASDPRRVAARPSTASTRCEGRTLEPAVAAAVVDAGEPAADEDVSDSDSEEEEEEDEEEDEEDDSEDESEDDSEDEDATCRLPPLRASEDAADSMRLRLERAWRALKTPPSDALDFALKYASAARAKRFADALTAWERGAGAIVALEASMAAVAEALEEEGGEERGEKVERAIAAADRARRRVAAAARRMKVDFDDVLAVEGEPCEARYSLSVHLAS
jgi:hypothetical protein